MLKWLLIIIGAALLAAALVPVGVTWIERRQSRDLAPRDPRVAGDNESRVAVLYFSRSGNTALAARHIANRLHAPLFQINAPDYTLGLNGMEPLHARCSQQSRRYFSAHNRSDPLRHCLPRLPHLAL